MSSCETNIDATHIRQMSIRSSQRLLSMVVYGMEVLFGSKEFGYKLLMEATQLVWPTKVFVWRTNLSMKWTFQLLDPNKHFMENITKYSLTNVLHQLTCFYFIYLTQVTIKKTRACSWEARFMNPFVISIAKMAYLQTQKYTYIFIISTIQKISTLLLQILIECIWTWDFCLSLIYEGWSVSLFKIEVTYCTNELTRLQLCISCSSSICSQGF